MAEIPPKPPWVNDDPAGFNDRDEDEQRTLSPRDDKGRFLPGQSGNPVGRPKGSKNKRTLMSEELEEAGSAVQRVVIAKALEGDMQAASLVMTRVSPPLRARPPTVEFEFDPNGTPFAMSSQILSAISKGQLDPDTGKMLLDCVAAHVGLRDIETFTAELERLRNAKGTKYPGGVRVQ